jgi:hypothetical protein
MFQQPIYFAKAQKLMPVFFRVSMKTESTASRCTAVINILTSHH